MRPAIIAFAVLAFVASAGLGATIHVPLSQPFIQDAIDSAADGDLILVAPGTYAENLDFKGKKITVRSHGGASATVIDGMGTGSVVVFRSGEGLDSVLEGFTITNGTGTLLSTSQYHGGGVLCEGAAPTIRFNIIDDNQAYYGGGIACEDQASPKIRGNLIAGNVAARGGGISIYGSSNPVIIDNVIAANTGDFGGGIRTYSSSEPQITNCLIIDNTTGTGIYGAGVASDQCNTVMNLCTVAHNQAGGSGKGGGICCRSGTVTLMDSIVWDNQPDEIYNVGGTVNATYSDIQGGWPGTGNILLNPLFVTGPLGSHPDFYLSDTRAGQGTTSPCVDAGNPATAAGGTTATDLWPDRNRADMGYHYPYATFYVPDDYVTIQAAIDAAIDGDRIVVRSGTYTENIDFKGKTLELIGEQGAAATVIDGGQAGSVVRFATNEGFHTVIDGFTITNGKAGLGGGIYCLGASPTIRYNVITDNESTANYGGGGIYVKNGDPFIWKNVIDENVATVSGGGMRVEYCSPTVMYNEISENQAYDGGGICGDHNTGYFAGNRITGNQVGRSGGGALFGYGSAAMLVSNLIADNQAASWGGGLYMNYGSDCLFRNNTLAGNQAVSGGGLLCFSCTVTATNDIFWDDTATTGPEVCLMSSAVLNLSYGDLDGGKPSCSVDGTSTLNWGTAMLDDDPLFVNSGTGDYHLTRLSPCVNRGTDSGTSAFDMDGDTRPQAGTTDMGSDEYKGTHALDAPCFTISAATGGSVTMTLDAGTAQGGRYYLVLGSVTGTVPGTPLGGGAITLPVNWDAFTNIVIANLNTAAFVNFMAALDGVGQSTAKLDTITSLPSSAVGVRMAFAFAMNKPWDFASNPVTIEIVP